MAGELFTMDRKLLMASKANGITNFVYKFFKLLVILTCHCCPASTLSLHSTQLTPDITFSIGRHFYSTLVVDPKSSSLYVGAHSHLFRLYLYNINDTALSNLFASRKLEVNAEEREECLRMGNSEMECENRARLIFLKPNGQILLCSSNAMKPQISTLDGVSLLDVEVPRTIIGICSPHEYLNTTAVYTEFGNPNDLSAIYSGIRTGLSLENHLIYRPPLVYNNKEVHSALRTIYTDAKWLNEPQFVGSYSINQYVYFFFREVAIEAENCGASGFNSGYGPSIGNGQIVYSRVARICKSDLGGKNVLRQVWSSFVKGRLNCSIVPSTSPSTPFYFDYIQSVFKVEQDTDVQFYATFTTSESPFQASAICVYSLNAINQIFDNGIFLEQPSVTSAWIPTQSDRVPRNRPGSCVSDSLTIPDDDLNFSKSHLLMADAIPGGEPLIYRKNEALTKIVVDQYDEHRAVLFAFSSHRRTLLKVLHVRANNNGGRGQLLAEYRLPSETQMVYDMAILSGKFLYLAETERVTQFSLSQCHLHFDCASCAADLYCSWDIARASCFQRELIHSTSVGWITSVPELSDSEILKAKCRNYVRSTKLVIYPGDSAHLACSPKNWETHQIQPTEWHFEHKLISVELNTQHIVHTVGGGIILLNATNAHNGIYQCLVQGIPIMEYIVSVDDADCARPKTIAQFHSAQREWCKKYDNYKSHLSKWQDLYEKNNSCSLRELADRDSS